MKRIHLVSIALGLALVGGLALGASRLRPDTPARRHVERARALAAEGKEVDAAHEWLVAIALDPTLPEPRERMAELYLAEGAIALAIRDALVVATRHPRRPHAYCRLAECYQRGNLSNEALVAARHALRIEPNCPRAHRTLGIVLVDREEYQSGLEHLARAAELEPRNARVQLALARVHFGLDQLAEAEAAARRALSVLPDDGDASLVLAETLLKRDPRTHAAEIEPLLRKAIAGHPDHPDAHASLGAVLLTAGKREEAMKSLRTALDLDPRHVAAMQTLAEALIAAGDRDEATRIRTRAGEIAREQLEMKELQRKLASGLPDGATLLRLGELHALNGDLQQAIVATERAAELLAPDPEPRRKLLELRRRAGMTSTGLGH